jgi:hypothetical protein
MATVIFAETLENLQRSTQVIPEARSYAFKLLCDIFAVLDKLRLFLWGKNGFSCCLLHKLKYRFDHILFCLVLIHFSV